MGILDGHQIVLLWGKGGTKFTLGPRKKNIEGLFAFTIFFVAQTPIFSCFFIQDILGTGFDRGAPGPDSSYTGPATVQSATEAGSQFCFPQPGASP